MRPLTQVIFQGIDSLLQSEIVKAGQVEGSLSLDQLFLLLRKDGLDAFMDKFGPIDPACPAFRMLKWIRNEEVHGFEYEEYSVNSELGEILNAVSKSVSEFQKWSRYNFRISVVGYTDSITVQGNVNVKKSRLLARPQELASRAFTLGQI